MKLKHIFLISLFLFVLVAGCIEQGRADDGRFTLLYSGELPSGGDIQIIHDNTLNVTLYETPTYYGYYVVSVIPDYELKKPANYTGV